MIIQGGWLATPSTPPGSVPAILINAAQAAKGRTGNLHVLMK